MRLLHWLPALIQATLIFLASHQTSPPGADLGPDYVLHAIGYLIFGAAVSWGMNGGLYGVLSRTRQAASWLIAAGYGILDEFHQSFIPGREPSVGDLAADAVGAAAGVILFLIAGRLLRRARG